MRIDPLKLDKQIALKKLTVMELCEKANVSRPTLWKIRKGDNNTKLSTIGKLAEALGCEIEDITE